MAPPESGVVAAKGARPSLPYVVSRLDRIVRHRVELALSPHGVSVTQYTVLSLLQGQSDLSGAQLARRAYVSPQSMHETLLGLENQGLVVRQPDPRNSRILRTRLTAAGKRLLSRCDEGVGIVGAAMTSGMAAEDQVVLRSLMIQAVRNLGGGFPERPGS